MPQNNSRSMFTFRQYSATTYYSLECCRLDLPAQENRKGAILGPHSPEVDQTECQVFDPARVSLLDDPKPDLIAPVVHLMAPTPAIAGSLHSRPVPWAMDWGQRSMLKILFR